MITSTHDFTRGPIFSKLISFMLPILLSLVLQSLYGAVDMLIVGRFGTTAGISGVAVGGNVMNLFTMLLKNLINAESPYWWRLACLALGCVIAGFSISMVMPACMGAASKLPGYEAVNTSLILGLAYVGIFIAPLITGVSASVTGSDAVSGRLLVIAAGALLLAGVTLVLRPGTYER